MGTAEMGRPSNFIFFSFSLLVLLLSALRSIAAASGDTIARGESLTANQTIVSSNGVFELGFFSPGKSRKHYIGIWYKNIPGPTVVWVANREAPITNLTSSILKLSDHGDLILFTNHSKQIWSSNSTTKPNSTSPDVLAVLLDTGNLVLRQTTTGTILWQSFDHPTDTWLPYGHLGMNKLTNEYQSLTSWKSADDPSPGLFSESLDPTGVNQHVLMWNRSVRYWHSGAWNGDYFQEVPGMHEKALFIMSFHEDDHIKYSTYNLSNNHSITRNVLDPSGQVQQWLWVERGQQWVWHLIYATPTTKCDVYGVCGANGVCEGEKATHLCQCLPGFVPRSAEEWSLGNWGSGCVRGRDLGCGKNSSKEDGFLPLPNMRMPMMKNESRGSEKAAETTEECQLECSRRCDCNGFSYGNDRTCRLWSGDLRNLEQLSGDSDNDQNTTITGTLFLRLAASEVPLEPEKPAKPGKRRTSTKIAIVSIIALAVLAIGVLVVVCCRKKRLEHERSKLASVAGDGSLVQFTHGELQRATRGFSQKLGSGSFGSVFKGTLPDSTVVAVKVLEGFRQGEKQFRAEVSTLGTVQHINLVRLRGYCSEKAKRLLIYDFMPNGSLDSYLFKKRRNPNAKSLDWQTRFNIALGVAKALWYLHEKCRDCIIHCDMKPENVLLDAHFEPKVADLGMAKLVGRNISRVLTTMRGTIGYLAPEWISGVPITPKADVYSFGMMLFEIVSDRRNNEQSDEWESCFFPVWAANVINKGEDLKVVVDRRLGGDVDEGEVVRACRVACWCIQDLEADRPTMGKVVQMLEGVVEVEVPPVPVSLQNVMEAQDANVIFFSRRHDFDATDGDSDDDQSSSSFVNVRMP